MKTLRSAKQLTIRYFSLVAIAIIAIHLSVFELTTEDLESGFVQNQLSHASALAKANSEQQGHTKISENTSVYFDIEQLPEGFPDALELPYDQPVGVEQPQSEIDLYAMRIRLQHNQDAVLVLDNSLYELTEEQIQRAHSKQVFISLTLMLLSLLVVIHISNKLTNPLATFSQTLATQDPHQLNPLDVPEDTSTKELNQLVDTFNLYQQQINALIEKERAFNRYASHELRSPLMVIKGAVTLLEASQDPAFTQRQLHRLNKAANEMSEFVETLLALSKPLETHQQDSLELNESLINQVVDNHIHLLQNKPVTWQLAISDKPAINLPAPAFHILLGNLLKNAFAYTEQGQVSIQISTDTLTVIDSGKGIETDADDIDGFGLGLLLVRDICQRYGLGFDIRNNAYVGSTATITFN